jgi:hypothetical protein
LKTPEILKAKDLAALTGLHPKHISRLARKGRIDGNRANPGGKQSEWLNDERIRKWIRRNRQTWLVKEANRKHAEICELEKKQNERALQLANDMRRQGMLLETAKAGLSRDNWKSYHAKLGVPKAEMLACMAIARNNPRPITDVMMAYRLVLDCFKRQRQPRSPDASAQ